MEAEGYGAYLTQVRDRKAEETPFSAAGCFWGMQDLTAVRGVLFTRVGIHGGQGPSCDLPES